MKRAGAVAVFAIFLFALYIIYTGAVTLADIILGALASVVAAYLIADIAVKNPGKVLQLRRWGALIKYAVLYFTIIEARAHWDVIKRILHPKMPVNPGIVRVPYNVETDYAITTIANSITNTPGTVTVDVDEKRKVLYVHWIDVKTTEDEKAREYISKTFEEYAKKIFD